MEALQRALKDNMERVQDYAKDAVSLTTFAIAQGVRARVPRGPWTTGLLAASITSSVRGLSGRVEIGVDAYYWHFLEYGTVKMEAKPFIRPAAEAEANNFERRIRDIAKRLEQTFSQARTV